MPPCRTRNLSKESPKLPEGRDQRIELLGLLEERNRRKARRKLWTFFPEEGALRRELYSKHMQFFALGGRHRQTVWCPPDCDGSPHRERCFLGGNQVGKTETAGGYEMTLHLTGRYPAWWTGIRFTHGIEAWTAGDTRETTKDIQQAKLLGTNDISLTDLVGTGLIPGDDIVGIVGMLGYPGACKEIRVKHTSGEISVLGFKSYDQKRKSFQGTGKHVIWLDEECPNDVYDECLARTTATNGMLMVTFTPLEGLTPLVLRFVPGGKIPGEKA